MHYSNESFSITMVTELRDGTSQAVTVKVHTADLQAQDDTEAGGAELAARQDCLNDNVIFAFWRLVKLWEESTPGDGNG